MDQEVIPKTILNWIDGEECEAISGDTFGQLSPVSGKELGRVARSRVEASKKPFRWLEGLNRSGQIPPRYIVAT